MKTPLTEKQQRALDVQKIKDMDYDAYIERMPMESSDIMYDINPNGSFRPSDIAKRRILKKQFVDFKNHKTNGFIADKYHISLRTAERHRILYNYQ